MPFFVIRADQAGLVQAKWSDDIFNETFRPIMR